MQETALALCIALNANVIIWGPPGAGKTEVLKSIARANNFHLEVVLLSAKEPSEVSGIPYVADGKEKTAPPEYVRNVMRAIRKTEDKPAQYSMVFWDEFSTALPSVQAPALTTFLDRKAGPYQMPMDTRMVAAANPPKIAANGWDLSAPTANRFTHIDWSLDATTIANGFQQGWTPPDIPRLPSSKNMEPLIQNAKILIGAFIRSKPDAVEFDFANYRGNSSADNFKASDNAFPTARSWEMAAKLYAGVKSARFADGSPLNDSILALLLEGTVGVAMASEFMAYANALDIPSPIEALNKPDDFELPARGDKISAVLASVQQQAISYRHGKNYARIWDHWGNIISRVIDQGFGDIALSFTQTWMDNIPDGSGLSDRHNKSISALQRAFGTQ